MTTQFFLKWMGGLNLILRCFVIALLAHLAILLLLTFVKIVIPFAQDIPAIFVPPDKTLIAPPKEVDLFARYRKDGYEPPGVKDPMPPINNYKVAIAQPTPAQIVNPSVVNVISIVNESDTARTRAESAVRSIAMSLGGGGNSLICVIGGRGKGPFDGRDEQERTKKMKDIPLADETERAVLAALRWLKNNQNEDGSWTIEHRLKPAGIDAGTSLAVLAFLGHGHTPDDKEFGGAVNRGITYLVNTIGADGVCKSGNFYAQGAVTLALAETYGMTKSKTALAPLERSVKAIIAAQKFPKTNPKYQGGWRYGSTALNSDTSVSGWCIMALKSARLAGIEVPTDVFEDASTFLWNMYDPKGGFGYQGPGRSPNLTGVGVLCQQFLGHYADPRLKPALDYLKTHEFNWDDSRDNALYGWYYITQAMFQGGGTYWEYWNNQFQKPLIAAQKTDGSWEQKDKMFGPVYATSLACLMLEVYYRYSPIYEEMERHAARPTAGPSPKK